MYRACARSNISFIAAFMFNKHAIIIIAIVNRIPLKKSAFYLKTLDFNNK